MSLHTLFRRLRLAHPATHHSDSCTGFWQSVPLLGWLDAADLGRLVGMVRARHVRAGSTLFNTGSHLDHIVIVKQGRIESFRREMDTLHPIDLITAGGLLGLDALMTRTPIAVDYIAQTDVELWEIPVDAAEGQLAVLRQAHNLCDDQHLRLSVLSQLSVFTRLASAQRVQFASAFHPIQIPSHCTILREGQNATGFFLIISGEVDVLVATAQGEEQIFTTLGPGESFGEAAVLTGTPVPATIRTRTPVDLLRLAPEDFYTIIGAHLDPLDDTSHIDLTHGTLPGPIQH